MIFEQIRTGGDRNFAYLVGDERSKTAAVVDPSNSPESVLHVANTHGLKILYIINTHGHYDHTNGNEALRKATNAKIVQHSSSGRGADVTVEDGDCLEIDSLRLQMIHTPGHTQDSICVLVEDKLMTGDTLFVGKVGGTSSDSSARQEYESLHKKLMTLPHTTEIYPGHDYGTESSSTVDKERRSNPFILQKTFEDFVHLKNNWAQYKREHGIR